MLARICELVLTIVSNLIIILATRKSRESKPELSKDQLSSLIMEVMEMEAKRKNLQYQQETEHTKLQEIRDMEKRLKELESRITRLHMSKLDEKERGENKKSDED